MTNHWVDDATQLIYNIRQHRPVCALLGGSSSTVYALQSLGIQAFTVHNHDHFADSIRHATLVVLDTASVYQYSTKHLRQMATRLGHRRVCWTLCADGAVWSRSVALMTKFLMTRNAGAFVATDLDALAIERMGGKFLSVVRRIFTRRKTMPQLILHDDYVIAQHHDSVTTYSSAETPRLEDAPTDGIQVQITAALAAACQHYKLPINTAAAMAQHARSMAHNTAIGRGSFLSAWLDALARFSAEKAMRYTVVDYREQHEL